MLSLEVSKRIGGADQLLQDRQHVRVPHHLVVDGVLTVRRLDPPHPRLLRAVRGLEVVDLVVLAHEAGLLDELVGDPAELRHVLGREHVLDHEEPILAIEVGLCLPDHR